jgi:NitT/TauT family transport system ATP-binding protein
MSAPPAVELRGAGRTYPNGTQALTPVSLAVHAGEFVTLLGPSGCGKTTALNLMAGLIAPTAGSVRWWGGEHAGTGGPGRAVGCVFQSPTLMPWARIGDNVRLPLDLAGMPRTQGESAARAALAKVGLAAFERHRPRELSGGMQMRASIARALVTDPDLLLLDEPFGALDEFTRQKLDGDLLAWWRERGLAVVFVTHSIQEAVFLSTRVVVLAARPGRVIADVAIDEPHPRGDVFRGTARFAAQCLALSELVARASSTVAGDA